MRRGGENDPIWEGCPQKYGGRGMPSGTGGYGRDAGGDMRCIARRKMRKITADKYQGRAARGVRWRAGRGRRGCCEGRSGPAGGAVGRSGCHRTEPPAPRRWGGDRGAFAAPEGINRRAGQADRGGTPLRTFIWRVTGTVCEEKKRKRGRRKRREKNASRLSGRWLYSDPGRTGYRSPSLGRAVRGRDVVHRRGGAGSTSGAALAPENP